MFLQRRELPKSWIFRKKKIASPRKRKRKAHVEDLEGWEDHREAEEVEEGKEEDFDWSKPIVVEDVRDYVRVRGK